MANNKKRTITKFKKWLKEITTKFKISNKKDKKIGKNKEMGK